MIDLGAVVGAFVAGGVFGLLAGLIGGNGMDTAEAAHPVPPAWTLLADVNPRPMPRLLDVSVLPALWRDREVGS